jgi:hypothetical protein
MLVLCGDTIVAPTGSHSLTVTITGGYIHHLNHLALFLSSSIECHLVCSISTAGRSFTALGPLSGEQTPAAQSWQE